MMSRRHLVNNSRSFWVTNNVLFWVDEQFRIGNHVPKQLTLWLATNDATTVGYIVWAESSGRAPRFASTVAGPFRTHENLHQMSNISSHSPTVSLQFLVHAHRLICRSFVSETCMPRRETDATVKIIPPNTWNHTKYAWKTGTEPVMLIQNYVPALTERERS